jgi:hypothetical protein
MIRVIPVSTLFSLIAAWTVADVVFSLGLHWFDLTGREIADKVYWEIFLVIAGWFVAGKKVK